MEDHVQAVADARRLLQDHLQAMAAAAETIEYLLVVWTHNTSWGLIEKAMNDDPHRTSTLQSAGSIFQMREEEEEMIGEFPDKIHANLARLAWRHLYVDPSRPNTGNIMSDLDYGIWQHSGYKIPPAYESVLNNLLSKVTQLLRKYGYRPEFGRMGAVQRHTAPPEAIEPMERYYKLSMRLPELVTAAEHARVRSEQARAMSVWETQ